MKRIYFFKRNDVFNKAALGAMFCLQRVTGSFMLVIFSYYSSGTA